MALEVGRTVPNVDVRADVAAAATRKVWRRVVPIDFAAWLMCYINRTSLAYVAEPLQQALDVSYGQYGLAASAFFITYSTIGLPISLLGKRFNARYVLAAMCAAWGATSMLIALANGVTALVLLRVLLGATQSGAASVMMYHLSTFCCSDSIGTWWSSIGAASAVSGVLGGPLAALILHVTEGSTMSSWRWLLVLEGIPSVALAFVIVLLLPESIDKSSFLSEEEREALVEKKLAEKQSKSASSVSTSVSTWDAIRDPRVLLLTASMVLLTLGYNGIIYWLPLVLQTSTNGDRGIVTVALLSAIPYMTGVVAKIAWAAHSDRTHERVWHAAIAARVGMVGFIATTVVLDQLGVSATAPCLATFSVTVAGMSSFTAPLLAGAADFLTEDAAAAGFALVVGGGGLGGPLGPYFVGIMKSLTGSFAAPMAAFAVCPPSPEWCCS